MPKVTPAHTEARRRQIMDAARACFLRDGFHATSMQDILREADLSSGAFYLYFKGKDDVVAAIAGEAVASLASVFTDLIAMKQRPPIEELVHTVLARASAIDAEMHVFPIAVQAWAESLRSPALAEILQGIYLDALAKVEELLAGYQADGLIGAEVPVRQQAAVILVMVQGFITQRAMFQALDADAFRAGLKSLFPGT